jgi:UDP-N-acetylglucosamine transferase subunit ALG13
LIFVTVGAQMAFDRLIEWSDDWAVANERRDMYAQIGPSSYVPKRLSATPFLDPPNFREHMRKARAIVAHAGMGTIITALEVGTPILVVPRLGSRSETRNDHQMATARRLEEEELVLAAYDRDHFFSCMERLESEPARPRIGDRASDSLLSHVRAFAVSEPG